MVILMSEETTNQPTAHWVDVASLDALKKGSLTGIAKNDIQLLLIRQDDGTCSAVENKCPHEGYPLSGGDLKGDKLTCCWHNWKFHVRDGSCILGGEGVRSFPTRTVANRLEVDISDPAPETLYPTLLTSFEEGLFKHENGRAARDGIRLLELGFPPAELLAKIAHYDALHAEYGSTHALPVSADCLRWLPNLQGAKAMFAIVCAIDMCGEANRRMPPRCRPAPKPHGTLTTIRALAESEEAAEAEALLLGAFDAGVERKEIERWLRVIISDHFTGFGHPLIYLLKAEELLDEVDESWARDIYGSLLYRYILATREDTLPYMTHYREHMDAFEPQLQTFFDRQDEKVPFDGEAFVEVILYEQPNTACLALRNALQLGVCVEKISMALATAGATRMLRFDPQVEKNPELAENWVWVTHRLTQACAVHQMVKKHPSSDSLRFLLHGVAFTNSGKKMDIDVESRHPIQTVPGTADDLLTAILAQDPDRAQGIASYLMENRERFVEFKNLLHALCLQDHFTRPIVVAHVIKTTAAAIEMYEEFEGHFGQCVGLLAVVRFLALGIQERSVRDMVGTSIAWVVDGKIPKKLTQ